MTDAEGQVVRAVLPVPAWLEGRGGRPESYCHHVMLDAVRYVVDNGVKWANLPTDFPPYRRVHAFARRWQVTGLLSELHDRLRDRVRDKEGRTVDPTAAVVDSQSLRAAANIPRSTSGWDGGKNVGGRKRHLVVDCLGLVRRALEPVELEAVQGSAHAHEGGVRTEPEVDVTDDVLLVGVTPRTHDQRGGPAGAAH
ncbi:transposase, partial [Streptomyces griseoruber]|uniref:transposase n=1 Tax=Streptomyces griseoruber TaxID=1943 RepID=UPI0037A568E2